MLKTKKVMQHTSIFCMNAFYICKIPLRLYFRNSPKLRHVSKTKSFQSLGSGLSMHHQLISFMHILKPFMTIKELASEKKGAIASNSLAKGLGQISRTKLTWQHLSLCALLLQPSVLAYVGQ